MYDMLRNLLGGRVGVGVRVFFFSHTLGLGLRSTALFFLASNEFRALWLTVVVPCGPMGMPFGLSVFGSLS